MLSTPLKSLLFRFDVSSSERILMTVEAVTSKPKTLTFHKKWAPNLKPQALSPKS